MVDVLVGYLYWMVFEQQGCVGQGFGEVLVDWQVIGCYFLVIFVDF